MNADLLPAQAAVDWAVSQLPILEKRIVAWYAMRPYSTFREFDSKRRKDAIKVRFDKPLPLIVNAEVGAIVNSIRSSLDLLAVALAERNGHLSPKDAYFPVCQTRATFLDKRRGGGMEKIARLSAADIAVIKKLKPYKRGNALLYSLHQMDIMRKHRSLITVNVEMARMTFSGSDLDVEIRKRWPPFKHQTTVAWIARDAPYHNFGITPLCMLGVRFCHFL